MSRRDRLTDLFFESRRQRLGNSLGFKFGIGCLSLLFLLCCAVVCLAVWFFWNFFSAFPRIDTRPRPELIFSPASLPDAAVGTSYDAAISISQNVTPAGQFYLSKGDELPPGLTLDEEITGGNTIHITGTPKKAGTYTFTVSVWCYGTSVSGQQGSKEYTIIVSP
jgi:hypothetical protein